MDNLFTQFPVLRSVAEKKELIFISSHDQCTQPKRDTKFNTWAISLDKSGSPVRIPAWTSMEDASQRLQRLAPLVKALFPEDQQIQKSGGIIESPLRLITNMSTALCQLPHVWDTTTKSIEIDHSKIKLFLKCDCDLPISGSIKARGGIYEVLKYAECLSIAYGLLPQQADERKLTEEKEEKEEENKLTDGLSKSLIDNLTTKESKNLFSHHSLSVGSTGNLGLSIGIIGARLGLKTTVHMSKDAKEWKKKCLRNNCVSVIEYDGDFSCAVENGRKSAEKDPYCHFIDDEKSADLFVGYAVAALRLKEQLITQGIVINSTNQLFVYLPCGVGGGPGGITFGLHAVFGENVHCFFAEPTAAPSFAVGMITKKGSDVAVSDIGLDCTTTIADGLAVGRTSQLVYTHCSHLVSGYYTVEDVWLCKCTHLLCECEGVYCEPSAQAGFVGARHFIRLMSSRNNRNNSNGMDGKGGKEKENGKDGIVKEEETLSACEQYLLDHHISDQAVHVVWATGGCMVPLEDRLK